MFGVQTPAAVPRREKAAYLIRFSGWCTLKYGIAKDRTSRLTHCRLGVFLLAKIRDEDTTASNVKFLRTITGMRCKAC